MKITVICECCNQPVQEESEKIQSTFLQEYIGSGGNSFNGFLCFDCKREINNAAFAEFKRIKGHFKNK